MGTPAYGAIRVVVIPADPDEPVEPVVTVGLCGLYQAIGEDCELVEFARGGRVPEIVRICGSAGTRARLRLVMLVDEAGQEKGLPPNPRASQIGRPVFGTALVCEEVPWVDEDGIACWDLGDMDEALAEAIAGWFCAPEAESTAAQ